MSPPYDSTPAQVAESGGKVQSALNEEYDLSLFALCVLTNLSDATPTTHPDTFKVAQQHASAWVARRDDGQTGDYRDQLYRLLVRKGLAQHEAHSIAYGDGL
jgi:hypothetical protein